MKRYEDINKQAEHASPELQMLLGELTLGRNLVEMNLNGLKADVNIATVPVMVDGTIVFRTVIFEKSTDPQTEREILAEVAMGNLYSKNHNCVVIAEDSVFQNLAKKPARKSEEE